MELDLTLRQREVEYGELDPAAHLFHATVVAFSALLQIIVGNIDQHDDGLVSYNLLRDEFQKYYMWNEGFPSSSGELDLILSCSKNLRATVLDLMVRWARVVCRVPKALPGYDWSTAVTKLDELEVVSKTIGNIAEAAARDLKTQYGVRDIDGESDSDSRSDSSSIMSVGNFRDIVEDFKIFSDGLMDLTPSLENSVTERSNTSRSGRSISVVETAQTPCAISTAGRSSSVVAYEYDRDYMPPPTAHRSSLSRALQRPLDNKQSSFKGEAATRTIHDDQATENDVFETNEKSKTDESAIDNDDASSSWESPIKGSGKSSIKEKAIFQHVESRLSRSSSAHGSSDLRNWRNLEVGRDLLPTIRQHGPSLAALPDSGDGTPSVMNKSGMQGQDIPQLAGRPIITTPSNVAPHQAALSPKITKKNKLQTELTVSHRQHPHWERQQENQTGTGGLDLEKELTCSICIDVLFQPLTLLDCLHTFCGACLKEWFLWQLTAFHDNPNSVPFGMTPYTCPSCRAPVRETKHNATVTTLLEMYLAAHPDKGKSNEEKESFQKKYTPGEDVMPRVEQKEAMSKEGRAEDEERRLVNEATARNSQEVGVRLAETRTTRRRRDEYKLGSTASQSKRETSRGSRSAEEREHKRLPEGSGEQEKKNRRDGPTTPQPKIVPAEDHRQRRSEEDTRWRAKQTTHMTERQLEHQASLRSLISFSDVESHKMEEEIIRQILEEGLLDGINLEHIDVDQEDQICERIAEAFRRRQRERARVNLVSSSNTSLTGGGGYSEPRDYLSSKGLRESSQPRTNPYMSSTHLEIRPGGESQRRQQTASGRQSSPTPITTPNSETTRRATGSHTDLSGRPNSSQTERKRPNAASLSRSITEALSSPRHQKTPPDSERASLLSSASPRSNLPQFPEQSLTCMRCAKPHIEYELHYNCSQCDWNVCLSCYRTGLGCLHWFGFGYAAWGKWEKLKSTGNLPLNSERPHILTANRFLPPKISQGRADGRQTITSENPQRLQSGLFCAKCLAWANECYWRCEVCNQGEWGFCNTCVNQGKCCSHPLMPLIYKPEETSSPLIRPTDDQQAPPSAIILTGPGIVEFGPFKPLTFTVTCDICRLVIQPYYSRYHCFSCRSSVIGRQPGDYDICIKCYNSLEFKKRISPENGHNGWRRCLQGHRTIIVAFEDSRGGRRRVITQDPVGGRGLNEKPSKSPENLGQGLQEWSWAEGSQVRLVQTDVSATAPTSSTGLSLTAKFPPVGGSGMKALALWSWYPKEGDGDELLFPAGAEVTECVDINRDWFWGVYMGAQGLFPGPYVRVLDKGPVA